MLVTALYTLFITICMSLFMINAIYNTQRQLQTHTLNDTFTFDIDSTLSLPEAVQKMYSENEYIFSILYSQDENPFAFDENGEQRIPKDVYDALIKQKTHDNWGGLFVYNGQTCLPQYIKKDGNIIIALFAFYL